MQSTLSNLCFQMKPPKVASFDDLGARRRMLECHALDAGAVAVLPCVYIATFAAKRPVRFPADRVDAWRVCRHREVPVWEAEDRSLGRPVS